MQATPNLHIFQRPGQSRDVITNLPSGVLYPSLLGTRSTGYISGAPPAFAQGYSLQHGLTDYPLALIDSQITRRGETVVDPELTSLRTKFQKDRQDFDWYVNQGPEVQQRFKAVAAVTPATGFPVYWDLKPRRGYEPKMTTAEPLVNTQARLPTNHILEEVNTNPKGGSLLGTLASTGLKSLASSSVGSLMKGMFKSGAKAAASAAGSALVRKGLETAKDAVKQTAKSTGEELLQAGKSQIKSAVQNKIDTALAKSGISKETRKRIQSNLEKRLDDKLTIGEKTLKRLGATAVNQITPQLPSLPTTKPKRKVFRKPQRRGGKITKPTPKRTAVAKKNKKKNNNSLFIY